MKAKIINGSVAQYPYGMEQLRADNPSTQYDGSRSLEQWFALTEAAEAGAMLVDVIAQPQPQYSAITHDIAEALPALQDGAWTQQWQLSAVDQASVDSRLVSARAQAWELIKMRRDHLSDTGGYKVPVDGVDKWFHSDAKSKTQQLSLVMMGAGVPAVQWKTMDGTKVTMSQALAGQIFQAAAAQDMALFAHAESLKAQVDAAADPYSIDITAGWPATFAA